VPGLRIVARRFFSLARLAVSIGLVLVVTAIYSSFLSVNPTTVALSYVVVILLVASGWGVVESMAASLAATACLNVFFLPPVGALTIADPQNWIALAAFLMTAVVASQLSGRARRRTVEALARQRDLERLYALSRGLLLSPGRPSLPAAIARHISEAFDFSSVGVYDHGTDTVSWAGPVDMPALEQKLRDVARQGISLQEGAMQVVAIRLGGAPIGSLAIPDSELSDTVLQSMTNLAAIGLERARGLEAAARAQVAQQSGELRATMLDALAHEFKTPLTSMKVAAADLRASVPGERNRELATIVDEDLDRLQSLVTDTVQMVRVDSGDFTPRPNDHSLSDIVKATLRQFETRLDGHAVVTRVPGSLSIHADRELLGLALRQLLDNAVKYSPATSTIDISATGSETIDIAVRNSGPPIPEREQARLFERFYRGSQARGVPGTGMGLAIVRQIAEAHRGTLSVSSSPGEGTEFRMSLPGKGARS
jgi:two-component system, OmpR family, sensor histidine kinase KdpD